MTVPGLNVVFRAEASNAFGLGHLTRCRALAEKLPLSENPLLVLRESPETDQIIKPLAKDGWNIHRLPEAANSQEDAIATASAANEAEATLIVTDLCHRDYLNEPTALPKYHRRLRGTVSAKVISIEDCRMECFTSHMAVIPYDCGGAAQTNKALDGCEILSGLDYYTCRGELSDAAAAPRDIRPAAQRILVSIGGGDPMGLTARVSKALTLIDRDRCEARVFIGPAATAEHSNRVSETCKGHQHIEVMFFTDEFAEQLLWADIAIIGEGLIRYEAAMMGTPSLTISQFDHDSDMVRNFFAQGSTRYIGAENSITEDEIADAVTSLLENQDARRTQSEAGKKMVDGRGAERIATHINTFFEQN